MQCQNLLIQMIACLEHSPQPNKKTNKNTLGGVLYVSNPDPGGSKPISIRSGS
jgi:hypothetical protein